MPSKYWRVEIYTRDDFASRLIRVFAVVIALKKILLESLTIHLFG